MIRIRLGNEWGRGDYGRLRSDHTFSLARPTRPHLSGLRPKALASFTWSHNSWTAK
ncbi:MAG: hypothetical protein KDA57_10480 [Planctomycetales bacterium]|nr:hypothetical protein [Planctomycetales bacterium]